MAIHLHTGDIPEGIDWGTAVAVDTEAMGLVTHRDRLCVVQLSTGNGDAHLVHFPKSASYEAPRLKALLEDVHITKIFHFARFDIAILKYYLGANTAPLFCTKIVSKLVRTYTGGHGLKNLCSHLLGIEISKQEQTSDWGADTLSEKQQTYAAGDVLYLHEIKEKLELMLERENHTHLAHACFNFLPSRAELDILGWPEDDIFAH